MLMGWEYAKEIIEEKDLRAGDVLVIQTDNSYENYKKLVMIVKDQTTLQYRGLTLTGFYANVVMHSGYNTLLEFIASQRIVLDVIKNEDFYTTMINEKIYCK